MKSSAGMKWFWIAVATALMLLIYFLPEMGALHRGDKVIELTLAGKACVAVLVFAIVLWVTEALPFAVTALLILVLTPLMGITEGMLILAGDKPQAIHGLVAGFKETVRVGMGNSIILFLLGVLLISAAITRSGLGERFAYLMLSRLGRRTDRVLLGFLAGGAALSLWITDMAVAAILMPLAVSILQNAGCKPLESNFGKALLISCAWGPLFGGIGTPAGCAPNPIAVAYLKSLANIDIGFVEWMLLGVPGVVVLVPLGWVVLLRMFPPEIDELPLSGDAVR